MRRRTVFDRQCYNMKTDLPWRFRDVLLVTLIISLPLFFAFPLLEFVLKSGKKLTQVFLYLVDLLTLFVPILWIRRFYMMGKGALGVRKGRWPFVYIAAIGAGTGAACFLIAASIWGPQLKVSQFLIDHLIKVILLPLSIIGFRGIVLSSLSEEVFFRGFLYGYLRSKIRIIPGLLVQSLIFGILHADYTLGAPFSLVLQKFLIGLVLGILYEASDSLYPSIICHGTINFLFSIARIQYSLGS